MKDKQDFILFCDNLEGQTALVFKEEVRKSEVIIWYGVVWETERAWDLWHSRITGPTD